MRREARADLESMNARHDISASSEPIDPAVLSAAEAESRIVQFGPMSKFVGVAVFITMFGGFIFLGANFRSSLRSYQGPIWLAVPALFAALVVLGYFYELMSKSRRTRRFRIALNKRGVPVCVECGYSLHGLNRAAPSCPECGAANRLPELTNEQGTRQEVSR